MTDPKTLVAKGYDEIAEAYLSKFGQSSVRALKLRELIQDLPPRSKVLDLGCGAGVPTARELVDLGFEVTGVDFSARQIALARNSVPSANFIQGDMTEVEFPAASFDAICAFYSITHIPREEHGLLLARISRWLRSGGRFIGSFGVAAGDWQGSWLGTTMYFSHHDAADTETLVDTAGLRMEKTETIKQDNEDASFLWVTARKL